MRRLAAVLISLLALACGPAAFAQSKDATPRIAVMTAFPPEIVALSANVMNHQIAEYLAAGMDGWVAKPIELEKLYAALDAALSGDVAEAQEEAA